MSGSRGFSLVVRSTASRVPQSTHCITRFRSWITSFFPRSSSSHRSTAKAYSNHISPPIGHLLDTHSPPGADFPYRKRSRHLLDTFWTPRCVFEPKQPFPCIVAKGYSLLLLPGARRIDSAQPLRSLASSMPLHFVHRPIAHPSLTVRQFPPSSPPTPPPAALPRTRATPSCPDPL